MDKRLFFPLLVTLLAFSVGSATLAADKVAFSTAVRIYAGYYLPVLAAEEKGFWKNNALEVEWVPFATSIAQMSALAAGTSSLGMATADAGPVVSERGVPVVMVAELIPHDPFIMWVKADSPYKHPSELKGKNIGIVRAGGPAHTFGRLIFKANGMEHDVKYIGTGGLPENMAALRVGSVEAIVHPLPIVVPLKVAGAIRAIASVADYAPKPWLEHAILARKDYARRNPEVVRRTIKAALQGVDFVKKNPRWALDKMKSFQGVSEEGAKLLYEGIGFTTTGRLDRKAVENLRNIFIEYGILTKEKAPAVDDLFTSEFLS